MQLWERYRQWIQVDLKVLMASGYQHSGHGSKYTEAMDGVYTGYPTPIPFMGLLDGGFFCIKDRAVVKSRIQDLLFFCSSSFLMHPFECYLMQFRICSKTKVYYIQVNLDVVETPG